MSYSGPPGLPPMPEIVSSLSRLGPATGSRVGAGATGSATWGTANRAFYSPVLVTEPYPVRRLYFANGSVATGNIDVGLFLPSGTRIVSAGSTAQSGTTQLQFLDVTDLVLAPGWYYLGSAASSTSSTNIRLSVLAEHARQCGVFMEESALPLPSTATFAQMTAALIPNVGFTSSSS